MLRIAGARALDENQRIVRFYLCLLDQMILFFFHIEYFLSLLCLFLLYFLDYFISCGELIRLSLSSGLVWTVHSQIILFIN